MYSFGSEVKRKENYKAVLVFGALSIIISIGISRFAFTPILPVMQDTFHFGEDLAGVLAGVNYLGYLIGAIACTVITRRNHKSFLFQFCFLICIATMFAMACTTSFIIWNWLRFFAGFASAVIFILASATTLDALATEGKNDLSGILYSSLGCGIVISGLAVPFLDFFFDWRGIWIGLAIPCFLLGVPCCYKMTGFINVKCTHPEKQVTGRIMFPLGVLYFAYFLEGLGYVVAGTFLVRMIMLAPGLESLANLSWVIVGAAGIPSSIIWSKIAKRKGPALTLVCAYMLQAVGMILPVVWHSKVAVLFCAFSFGGTFIGIVNLTLALGRNIHPHRSRQVIGKLTALFGVGQIIGPIVAGIIAERTNSFEPAFFLASLVIFMGGIIMLSGSLWRRPALYKVDFF